VVVLEEKEVHLVKRVSKKLGLTYRELGEAIGYTESSLKKSVYDNKISIQLEKAIELYIKNIQLEKKIFEIEKMKQNVMDFFKNK
jgi:hypothetical protein